MIFCVVCCASVLVDLRIVWENSPQYHRYLWKIINMPSLSYLYGFSDCCEGVISYQVFKKSPLIVHHFISCQYKTDYPFMIHHSLHRLKQAIYQHFTRNHTTRKKEWVFLNYKYFFVWSLPLNPGVLSLFHSTSICNFPVLLFVKDPKSPTCPWTSTRNVWFLTPLINFPIMISYSRANFPEFCSNAIPD